MSPYATSFQLEGCMKNSPFKMRACLGLPAGCPHARRDPKHAKFCRRNRGESPAENHFFAGLHDPRDMQSDGSSHERRDGAGKCTAVAVVDMNDDQVRGGARGWTEVQRRGAVIKTLWTLSAVNPPLLVAGGCVAAMEHGKLAPLACSC